jgi:hypothetical protein
VTSRPPQAAHQPIMMQIDNPYPTDEALDALASFTGTPGEFLQAVHRQWNDGHGRWDEARLSGDRAEQPGTRVVLVTGGWSGNESVIAAVQDTMFHLMFWYSSTRGGLHEYRVPETLARAQINFALPRRPC